MITRSNLQQQQQLGVGREQLLLLLPLLSGTTAVAAYLATGSAEFVAIEMIETEREKESEREEKHSSVYYFIFLFVSVFISVCCCAYLHICNAANFGQKWMEMDNCRLRLNLLSFICCVPSCIICNCLLLLLILLLLLFAIVVPSAYGSSAATYSFCCSACCQNAVDVAAVADSCVVSNFLNCLLLLQPMLLLCLYYKKKDIYLYIYICRAVHSKIYHPSCHCCCC